MRAFIALEPPVELTEDVVGMARVLSAAVEGRFAPRQNHHLTLAFLGEIGEADAQQAMAAMDEACMGAGPIPLRSDGLGKFGRSTDATLWLGIAPEPALMELAERLREALRTRGIAFDDKPFRPHLTLARRVKLPEGPLPNLAFPLPTEASRITLFKSTLSREGAEYKPLYSRDLA